MQWGKWVDRWKKNDRTVNTREEKPTQIILKLPLGRNPIYMRYDYFEFIVIYSLRICRLHLHKFTYLLNHSCNLLSNTLALSRPLVDFNRVPRHFSHPMCGFPTEGDPSGALPSRLSSQAANKWPFTVWPAMFLFLCFFLLVVSLFKNVPQTLYLSII